jgi:hypothetical protein
MRTLIVKPGTYFRDGFFGRVMLRIAFFSILYSFALDEFVSIVFYRVALLASSPCKFVKTAPNPYSF